jgi:Domain of unknown function (DUF4345)
MGSTTMKSLRLLNVVLMIVGLAIALLGLNTGLGGIRTLGWQGARDFIAVTDDLAFVTQDSHTRFLGGIWFGFGALFFLGGFRLDRLRPTLILLCGAIAMAGLFRFSGPAFQGIAIAPSLALELLGFPALALWLARTI